MNTLIDWIGKTEDIELSYDVAFNKKVLQIPENFKNSNDYSLVNYTESDNLLDITDITWNEKIEKADKNDYLMAIGSGVIASLIDIFYVGDFSLERANEWGNDKVNKFVQKIAKLNGFKGNDLKDAVTYMENEFKIAADSKTADFGGGLQHHLRDFSHHFSLGGLISSLYTQFSGNVIGTDTEGKLLVVKLDNDLFVGKTLEEKIMFGVIDWFFHMASDMAGSHMTAGSGTGIPGPFVSLLKELSSLPCFKDKKINETDLHVWVSKLFNGTLLAKRDSYGKIVEAVKFDLRTEIGILHEVGRQAVPVIINECLVRTAYFIRRLYISLESMNVSSIEDFSKIDSSKIIPFNNRTIKRMVTISSGTFTAIDTVEASIYATIKNGGINAGTLKSFAVRINIVGIGRTIIACKTDACFIAEDIKEYKQEKEKIANDYGKLLSNLKCLTLNYEQIQILHSLEKNILEHDIESTKNLNAQKTKELWKKEWIKKILATMNVAYDDRNNYFLNETEIINKVNENTQDYWPYLIIMEAILFKPYFPIYNDKSDKKLKKLTFKECYLENNFVNIQTLIKKEDIQELKREYKKSLSTILESNKKITIGAVGTVATAVITGGLGFAFAPAIATTIVGEGAAGLSGAALVSYSLAAIGGGSLAAGGLGMAGGTMIITGGGALIGALGGTGVSATSTIKLLSQNGYVLNECTKLLTFSKIILVKKFNDYDAVYKIYKRIDERIVEIHNSLDSFLKNNTDKEVKTKIKVANKSVKYLNRCKNSLSKIIINNK